MFEVFLILVVMMFAFGQAHIPFVNGILWFLDDADGVETTWSFDTFLTTMLLPLALILSSLELYFLFSI
jgi:hypothetical protein